MVSNSLSHTRFENHSTLMFLSLCQEYEVHPQGGFILVHTARDHSRSSGDSRVLSTPQQHQRPYLRHLPDWLQVAGLPRAETDH